jgi:hypothetical protein
MPLSATLAEACTLSNQNWCSGKLATGKHCKGLQGPGLRVVQVESIDDQGVHNVIINLSNNQNENNEKHYELTVEPNTSARVELAAHTRI